MVIIPLLIAGYLIFVNKIVISIRLNELKNYLQETDKNEGGIDHIALIATYEIHKKIYEERMSQDDADTAENKLSSLSLPIQADKTESLELDNIISLPALYMINFNRRILGKPPVTLKRSDDRQYKVLDEAYYHERNFMFKHAIALYDKALENHTFSSRYRSSILLRQGYCYALAGYNDMAMKNYNTIIRDYSQESSAITASILIRYLEGFTLARERVLLGESNPVLKSRKLVNLLAYEHALKIIEEIEIKTAPSELPSIRYFKARCYSGLGDPEKAVENYLMVITSAPDSPYAKYSNRKLYMIGKSAGGDNKIIALSKNINKKLNDPVFEEIISTGKDSSADWNAIIDPITVNVPDSLKDKVENLTSNKALIKDTFLVIITSDGNTFKGKLIEKNIDYISLETSIGRIDVKRDKITKVTEQD
jgi:tetratricopeptide (TPR) repeat protein